MGHYYKVVHNSWPIQIYEVKKQGEDKIEFEKVLGYHQHNHAGLDFIKQTEVPPKQTHNYRKLVSDKVHDLEEERYLAKAVQLHREGNWARWCNYIQNELSWKHLLVTSPRVTSFVLGATFDTLSSPTIFILSYFIFRPVYPCRRVLLNRGKKICSSKKKPMLEFCLIPQNGSSLLILTQALYSPLSLLSLVSRPRYCYTLF